MISGAAFSASLVACVRIRHVIVLAILLVPAGMAWLWVLMSATGALQVFLPGWVRARGLSTFNIVFADGQAIGAFFWGLLAQWVGFVPAFIAAAAVMALSTVTVAVWPFHDVSGLNRDLAVVPLPELAREPAPEAGKVLVTLTYIVEERHIPAFREAMELVRRSRQRTGATRCDLYHDGTDLSVFMLVSDYPTSGEHLRHHTGRMTGRIGSFTTTQRHSRLVHPR
jgi:quinol monooxygenase YgiN